MIEVLEKTNTQNINSTVYEKKFLNTQEANAVSKEEERILSEHINAVTKNIKIFDFNWLKNVYNKKTDD